MQRAAITINVAAVGCIVNRDYLGAQTHQELRRQLVRGAVCAINNDRQIRERKIMSNIMDQVIEISRPQFGGILWIVGIGSFTIVWLGIRNDALVTDVLLN